jgi:branched-chain amino acid transport system permease protein
MELGFLLQVIVSGLTLGSLYALVGMGFVLIYKATGILNFCQGEMVTVGGILAIILHLQYGVPYWPTFVGICLLGGMLGWVVERLACRPLRNAPLVTVILATVAVGALIRSSIRIFHGQELSLFPPLFSTKPFQVAGVVTLTPLNLGIVAIALALMFSFSLFFQHTRIGKGMRATSQNRDAAALVGISVSKTYARIWGLSAALAGIAGILLAPLIVVTPDMGVIAIKGFAGAILGGFTAISGAVLGGFLLGVIENLAGVYIASEMKDVVSFIVLLLVLLIRPRGLLVTARRTRV